MIVYHGTTVRRAQRICQEGFQPRKPSRRVWFAESRAYALQRAKTQARRSHDRPCVLTCNLDVSVLRNRLGRRRVFHRNRVLAIDAAVPVSVLRSQPFAGVPTTPDELARWLNGILHLKPHKGVGRNHPGIDRLSRWIAHRLACEPRCRLRPTILLALAKRWLPEFFEGVELDVDNLRAYPTVGAVEVEVDEAMFEPDPREEEALDCLEDPRPKRRVRGLQLLAGIEDPELFDWCVMYLDDESPMVQVAALRAMLRCDDGHAEVIEPLADSPNHRVRAAALAALAKHGGREAPRWFARGLKDPSPCVRVATARLLERLDPAEHRPIFELALYDPNPDVARAARKLAAHKGYAKLKW